MTESLEIVSIGVLYEGPWEKNKYWSSSSRGKDRYPYPVGYQAVRVHNGITYHMEIRQGPLFHIKYTTTNDNPNNDTCGETPHIAFQNLLKLSNKKKIDIDDAAHFFGFRNPLVLRMLRGLLNRSPKTHTPVLLLHDNDDDDDSDSDSDSKHHIVVDSVAQSMVSLLLPQALPLLNHPTKKTKLNPVFPIHDPQPVHNNHNDTLNNDTLKLSSLTSSKPPVTLTYRRKKKTSINQLPHSDEKYQVPILDSDRQIHNPPALLEEPLQSSIDKDLAWLADLEEFTPFLQESTNTFATDTQTYTIDMLNAKLRKCVELVGCYNHSMPISSVISRITENEIYLGVACGPSTDRVKTLFIYKIPLINGCPSFIGHASIMLLAAFCRHTSADFQFTPDCQSLVLLNSVKASYCREGKAHCPCSVCTSARFEENAVRIVHVKSGYVSLVAKMKTDGCALSMLVCAPDRLVALEEGGRLHLWVMNSEWSVKTGEFFIPGSHHISPSVEELKQIPNRDHLIIGHNGYGEFILWDISKRIVMSRFSAPSRSILQFLPISLFGWRRNKSYFSNPIAEEQINNMMAATKISLSCHTVSRAFLPVEEEAVGIWLLVSTMSDSDAQCNSESKCQVNPVQSWRLALLVENLVILGDVLDQSASVVGVSAGCGMMATRDGLVYMWELATGTKLGTLHHFKNGGVSCISTDYSRWSGVLAVAGDARQLRIYLLNMKEFDSETTF